MRHHRCHVISPPLLCVHVLVPWGIVVLRVLLLDDDDRFGLASLAVPGAGRLITRDSDSAVSAAVSATVSAAVRGRGAVSFLSRHCCRVFVGRRL